MPRGIRELSSVSFLVLLSFGVGCTSTKEYRAVQEKHKEAVHQAELRTVERDAARRDAEREAASKREFETALARQRSEFEDITTRQDEEIKKLQQERDLLKARLQSAEIQPIIECQEQVRSCRAIRELKEEEWQKQVANHEEMLAQKERECQQQATDCQQLVGSKENEKRIGARACDALLRETEEKARYKGMLMVWESLSVKAKPSTEGLVFKDYFLDVNVNVRNHTVYSFRVKTAESENGFATALSTAADLATVAKYVN
jgi:hypothetical protein